MRPLSTVIIGTSMGLLALMATDPRPVEAEAAPIITVSAEPKQAPTVNVVKQAPKAAVCSTAGCSRRAARSDERRQPLRRAGRILRLRRRR